SPEQSPADDVISRGRRHADGGRGALAIECPDERTRGRARAAVGLDPGEHLASSGRARRRLGRGLLPHRAGRGVDQGTAGYRGSRPAQRRRYLDAGRESPVGTDTIGGHPRVPGGGDVVEVLELARRYFQALEGGAPGEALA